MAYINKAYILTKIAEAELDNLSGSNDANITAAIESAESLVNSYLRKRINTIPIPDEKVPVVVKQSVYDITIFYLHDRIQYSEIPQWVKDKYSAAIDWLTNAAKGLVELGITEDDDTTSDAKADVFYKSNTRIINRGSF